MYKQPSISAATVISKKHSRASYTSTFFKAHVPHDMQVAVKIYRPSTLLR